MRSHITFPPITDPVVVAEWRDYERKNQQANLGYAGEDTWTACRHCGLRFAHVKGHEWQCKERFEVAAS